MSWNRLHSYMEKSFEADAKAEQRARDCETGAFLWCCDVRSQRLWRALEKLGKVENKRMNGTPFYRWKQGHKRERFARAARSARPLCGARCRNGQACRARVCARANGTLARRCRLHGGLSTGPNNPRTKDTPEMRAAYFAALVECGQRVEASRRVGLAYKTILRWCERDSEFEAACRAAYRLHYARGGGDWTAFEKFQAVQEARARGVIS